MNWPHQQRDQTETNGQHELTTGKERHIKKIARCFTLDKDTYTSGQAARLLDIPARTLRRYLSIGKIEGIQNPITQTWQISAEALSRFIQTQGGEVIIQEHPVTVLVIDGKPQIAELLNRFAAQRYPHMQVKAFQELGDALIESGANPPDLIVIDADSPFYDGVALMKLIRSNPHTSASKILAITDASENASGLDAMGATTTLVKPFSYSDLAQTVMYMFPVSAELSS